MSTAYQPGARLIVKPGGSYCRSATAIFRRMDLDARLDEVEEVRSERYRAETCGRVGAGASCRHVDQRLTRGSSRRSTRSVATRTPGLSRLPSATAVA